MHLNTHSNQKIYFASDFHLGVPNKASSRTREDKIIRWLNACKHDAKAIFLVGDLFDFWFEYNHAVPRGYTRFLGTLGQLADKGIELYIFTGNHDLWMFGYLEEELGATILKNPVSIKIDDNPIYIGHGDGLGPGDNGYKFLKKIFTNPFFQWCFQWLHPNVGIAMANFWSKKSRANALEVEQKFLGEGEWLWKYAKELEANQHHDYYVFGHRHLPLDLEVGKNSRYINLGEWLTKYTYAVYQNGKIELKTFED